MLSWDCSCCPDVAHFLLNVYCFKTYSELILTVVLFDRFCLMRQYSVFLAFILTVLLRLVLFYLNAFFLYTKCSSNRLFIWGF